MPGEASMSEMGRRRRFDTLPTTSGLPRITDIIRPARLVRFVPKRDAGKEAQFGKQQHQRWVGFMISAPALSGIAESNSSSERCRGSTPQPHTATI
jgi:hypothetical protein